MATPWFFLSYAHLDSDAYLKRFHRDLSATVGRYKGLQPSEVGFIDTSGIETGDCWSDTLVSALQTTRVLLVLYSPTYFSKEYCGKEWQVFQWRLEAYATRTGGKLPPLIIPVLWVPKHRLATILPEAVSEIQYTHGAFGDVYAEEGLRQIMALSKHRDEYKNFIHKLANQLIDVPENYNLPPVENLPPLHHIPSMFHKNKGLQEIAAGDLGNDNVGPRYIQFIFVAGQREEFKGIRNLDCYGAEGGLDWLPYLPDVRKEVAILAQELAVEMDLRYETIPFHAELVKRIREAERQNKLVVIIADTWTLSLERYDTVMREYDGQNFLNSVVLIAWNPNDSETMIRKSALESAIRVTFFKTMANKNPNTFLDSVTSYDQFKRELSAALNAARERIIEKGKVMKRAESEKVIRKPIIPGPGRTVE